MILDGWPDGFETVPTQRGPGGQSSLGLIIGSGPSQGNHDEVQRLRQVPASRPMGPMREMPRIAQAAGESRDDPKLKYVFPDVLQGSQSDTPDPPPIDFAWLAAELRKVRKAQQARLVEFMADKEMATVEDVAEAVHDFGGTDEG